MRLFIALGLPAEIRESLAMLRGGIAGARWLDPENMHLTLRFIGDADGGQLRDLDAELSAIRLWSFELMLSELGTFERRQRIHMLWAGIETSPVLLDLRERVEAASVRAGFGPEGRKYKPHVTLARFKNGSGPEIGAYLTTNNHFSEGPFSVERFTLFRSHLGHDGARYEVVRDYQLETAYT